MKVFLLVVTTLVVAINAQSESKQFMPPVPSPSMPLPPIPSPSMPLPPIPSPSLPPVPVPSPSMPPQPSPGTGGGGNGGTINNCPLDSRCPAVNPATPVLLPNSVCTRFLKCHNGRACQYDCPPGLHFNSEKLVCDWPEQACCDPSVPCRPADNGNGQIPSPSPSLPPSLPPVWNPSPSVPIPQPPTLTPRPPSPSPSPSVPIPQPPTLTPRPPSPSPSPILPPIPSPSVPLPPTWSPSPSVPIPQPPGSVLWG